MLRPIGELISHCFYGDGLSSSRPAQSSYRSLTEAFPGGGDVVLDRAPAQRAREKRVGTSYWNESELRLIRKRLNDLQQRAAANDEHA